MLHPELETARNCLLSSNSISIGLMEMKIDFTGTDFRRSYGDFGNRFHRSSYGRADRRDEELCRIRSNCDFTDADFRESISQGSYVA